MTTIDSISSISSAGVMPPPPPMGQGPVITNDQMNQLEEILAKYDSENMTDTDVQSMREEIKEAGIRPSEDLKIFLEEAGFEVEPPQGGPPPMGMHGAGRPEPPQFVLDFVDKALNGEVTEDDVTSFLEAITSQFGDPTGIVIDEKY